MKNIYLTVWFIAAVLMATLAGAQTQTQNYKVDSLQVEGGAGSEKGSISIIATIADPSDEEKEAKLIFSLDTDSVLSVTEDDVRQTSTLRAGMKHGEMKQLSVRVSGKLPIETVRGENIKAWSLQRRPGGAEKDELYLVVDLEEPLKEGSLTCVVEARETAPELPAEAAALFFSPSDASLSTGKLRVEVDEKLAVEKVNAAGLDELDGDGEAGQMAYSYTGGGQSLSLQLASKQRPDLHFKDFKLSGSYEEGRFHFTLSGVAEVFNQGEFKLPLLGGAAALSAAPEIEGATVRFKPNAYLANFDEPGSYPVELAFDARVTTKEGRSRVRFDMMDSALQPVSLKGIPVDADRVTLNGLPMEQKGDALTGSLSGDGSFRLSWTDPSWKSLQPGDAPLFYAAESVSNLEVGPGLVRQEATYSIRIMQGTMRTLVFDIEGEG
ncbi:MAG TPA: hypothetical protein VJ952_04785, partial [Opitutales bacterium]|nr:hypothetical protein [Opitutales bacterium]